jgi:hypothetical protein
MSVFFDSPMPPPDRRGWFGRARWFGGLFGAQQVPTSQKFQDLPPELQGLATTSANFLKGQIGVPAPAYPYAIAAPFSPTQRMASSFAENLGITGGGGPAGGYTDDIVRAMELQKQQDLSRLRSEYGNIGLANSEQLARSEGELGTRYAGAEAQTRLQAIPMNVSIADLLARTGGMEQTTVQNYLSAAYQDWLRQQQGMWQAAGMAQPYALQAFRPQTYQYAPSLFSQIAEAATGASDFFAPPAQNVFNYRYG